MGVDERKFACDDSSDCVDGYVCRDLGDPNGPICVRRGRYPTVDVDDSNASESDGDTHSLEVGDDTDADVPPQRDMDIRETSDGRMDSETGRDVDCTEETSLESCDGIDNDCDGTTDEGCDCIYDPTDSDQTDGDGDHDAGICRNQVKRNDGRCSKPQTYEERSDTESNCDTLDNDCDGHVDEGCGCTFDPTQTPARHDTDDTHSNGVCLESSRDSSGVCQRPSAFEGTKPDDETGSNCNDRLDNDCDGTVNDGCKCSPEICDARDNDCDGAVDEWTETNCRSFRLLGTSNRDRVLATAAGTSGALYAAGETEGSLANNTYKGGGGDGFVAKYDSSGRRQWVKYLATSSRDIARGVAADGSGAVFVVGETEGALGGNGNQGKADAFVAKFDSQGNRKRVQLLGSSSVDRARSVATDGSGAAYVVGETKGTLGNRSNSGKSDGFVAKYDAAVLRNWVRMPGSSEIEELHGAVVGGNGAIYVAGTTAGGFGGQSAVSGNDTDGLRAKYDSSGTQKWVRIFGSSLGDRIHALDSDGSGHLYAAGETDGSFGGQSHAGSSKPDAFLVQFDRSGNRSWVRFVGTSRSDQGFGVAADGTGNGYLAGTTDGKLAGRPNSGCSDAFGAKFDASGNSKWTRSFGTGNCDRVEALAAGPSGRLYGGGLAQGTLGGWSQVGGFDGFVVQFQ